MLMYFGETKALSGWLELAAFEEVLRVPPYRHHLMYNAKICFLEIE